MDDPKVLYYWKKGRAVLNENFMGVTKFEQQKFEKHGKISSFLFTWKIENIKNSIHWSGF